MSDFKPNIFIPSNIRSDKRKNNLVTETLLNNAINLRDWMGIDLQSGDGNLFLSQNGTWQNVSSTITGDSTRIPYFDLSGNITSDAGFIRDFLGATTKIYADESNIFGGIFLNGAVGQFGYSNNSIALNNYYFADSGNLGWAIGANTWTLPTTDGSLGDILTTNGLGQLSWTTPGGGGLTFDNGLTETAGNVQLGGTLIQNTDIDADGYLYSLTNTYANYISGTSGGITANWIRKNTSPTVLTAVGMADFSGFGQDVNTVVLGTLDFGGNPSTNMRILPTTGELRSLFVSGSKRAFFDIQQGTDAPDIMLLSRLNQIYQTGLDIKDDFTNSGTIHSNLHFAYLDSGNNVNILTKLEASNSAATGKCFLPSTNFNGFRVETNYTQLEFDKTADDNQASGYCWTLDAIGFSAYCAATSATPIFNILPDGTMTTTAGEIKKIRIVDYGTIATFVTTDYHLGVEGSGIGITTVDISGMHVGQIAIISDIDYKAGANNISIDAGTGKTICSLSGVNQTYDITTDGESVTIQRISTNKFKMI